MVKSFKNCVVTSLLCCLMTAAYSQDNSLDNQKSFNLDKFFRSINFKDQVDMGKLINLAAQFPKGSMSTTDVHDFTNFVLVAQDKKNSAITLLEFDRNQKIHSTSSVPAWIGTYPFKLKDIPQLSLQEGLQNVQTCMADKGEPIPSREIAGVIIYNLMQAQGYEMHYDYIFTDPNMGPEYCREYVYTPPNAVDPKEKCQMGYKVNCHFDINSLMPRLSTDRSS